MAPPSGPISACAGLPNIWWNSFDEELVALAIALFRVRDEVADLVVGPEAGHLLFTGRALRPACTVSTICWILNLNHSMTERR